MSRGRTKNLFSLSPVEFKTSAIEGRGVFARKRLSPGDFVVAYAPKHKKLDAGDPEAHAAAETKLTLLSDGWVLVPDTSVPGGWLCNHSCAPNAALYSDRGGRVQATREIAPGEEVTIFYGWVTRDEPERDPCRCGAAGCLRFINFDVSTAEASCVEVGPGGQLQTRDDRLRHRLEEYAAFLRSIGQEHIMTVIANTIVGMQL